MEAKLNELLDLAITAEEQDGTIHSACHALTLIRLAALKMDEEYLSVRNPSSSHH
jgi:hypothetical protein